MSEYITKPWDWSKNTDNHWLIPCIESAYLAERWQGKGFSAFLDLGCGLGRHSIYMAKKGFDVTAFDLSDYGVNQLNKWAENENLHISTAVCNMNVKIELHEELREQNLGEAVGKTSQWAKENALPVNSFDDRQFHGAESWRELWDRVSSYCNKIITDKSENIILVSHGVTLSVWQSVWLGLDIHEFKYSGLPGGVSFMSIDENGIRQIDKLNISYYMKEQK